MKCFLISCLAFLLVGITSCEQEPALQATEATDLVELGSYEQLESLLFDLAMEMDESQTVTILSSKEKGYYAQIEVSD